MARKERNAIIRLPKIINKVNIPMKIEIISKAVIGTFLHDESCKNRLPFSEVYFN